MRTVGISRVSTIYALVILALGALSLSACSSAGASPETGSSGSPGQTRQVAVEGAGSYTDVSAAGLASMLKNKDFPLINVHIPYAGEIEGTDLFIPYDQIDRQLDKLPADKSSRIVLYCHSGNMSSTAARTLVKLGYTNVWNLDGGMIAWEQAGHPLVNKKR